MQNKGRKARVGELEDRENWRKRVEGGVTYFDFRHSDGQWERRFYIAESSLTGAAGPLGPGLFAARTYTGGEHVCVYLGKDLGEVGLEESRVIVEMLCRNAQCVQQRKTHYASAH